MPEKDKFISCIMPTCNGTGLVVSRIHCLTRDLTSKKFEVLLIAGVNHEDTRR